MIRASRLRLLARFAVAMFVAMVGVTVVAPWVHPAAEDVCSASGMKSMMAADDTMSSHDSGGHDHAAHCPLCMPAGAPPSMVIALLDPDQPLGHVQQSIPAARLASLVGAPLPARGPPSFA